MAVHERAWERQGDGDAGWPPVGSAADPKPWRPVGTYALLGAMAVVYVLELALANHPSWGAWFVVAVDWPVRPWSPFTSTLAHSLASPAHLLFNGMFLYFVGPLVERIVGTGRMVALTVLAGAFAGIAQVEVAAAFGQLSGALGISGGLNALFGVVMVLLPHRKMLFFGIVPMPVWAMGVLFAALDVLRAFNPESPVAAFAHLTGLALGLLYGLWVKRDLAKRGLRVG